MGLNDTLTVTDVTMIIYSRYGDASMLRMILVMTRFLSNDCTGCDGDSNRCNGDVTVTVTAVTVIL